MYAFAGVKPKIVLSDSITPILLGFNKTFEETLHQPLNVWICNRRGRIYKEPFSSMNKQIMLDVVLFVRYSLYVL